MVNTLESYFERIVDIRRPAGRRYSLAKLLTIVTVGMLSNAHGYRELARFMKSNIEEIRTYFNWNRKTTPSYETLRNIFAIINFNEVNQVFIDWVKDQSNLIDGDWVALDGKAIRSTMTEYNSPTQDFSSLVSAFSHRLELTIDQESFHNKEVNEWAAIEKIIHRLNNKGLVLTLDALHCQKKSSNNN